MPQTSTQEANAYRHARDECLHSCSWACIACPGRAMEFLMGAHVSATKSNRRHGLALLSMGASSHYKQFLCKADMRQASMQHEQDRDATHGQHYKGKSARPEPCNNQPHDAKPLPCRLERSMLHKMRTCSTAAVATSVTQTDTPQTSMQHEQDHDATHRYHFKGKSDRAESCNNQPHNAKAFPRRLSMLHNMRTMPFYLISYYMGVILMHKMCTHCPNTSKKTHAEIAFKFRGNT